MCLTLSQIWVKPSAEMQFLYGNHVLKSGLGRITENTPAYTGVVIYSMSDVPLGFGVTAKSTNECRALDPAAIVSFHQADVGRWLALCAHFALPCASSVTHTADGCLHALFGCCMQASTCARRTRYKRCTVMPSLFEHCTILLPFL